VLMKQMLNFTGIERVSNSFRCNGCGRGRGGFLCLVAGDERSQGYYQCQDWLVSRCIAPRGGLLFYGVQNKQESIPESRLLVIAGTLNQNFNMSSRVFTILLCVLLLTTALIFVRRLSEQNEATVTELAGGTLQTQESAQPPAPLADARSLNVSDPADGATGLRRLLEANPEVRGLAASVSADIQTRFADFVAGLNLPADRELQVWNQLQLAYEEIYGAAAMLAENPAALFRLEWSIAY